MSGPPFGLMRPTARAAEPTITSAAGICVIVRMSLRASGFLGITPRECIASQDIGTRGHWFKMIADIDAMTNTAKVIEWQCWPHAVGKKPSDAVRAPILTIHPE